MSVPIVNQPSSQSATINSGIVMVVIVGYKSHDDVAKCLKYLSESSFMNFSIVICENGGAQSCKRLINRISAPELCVPLNNDLTEDEMNWTGRLAPNMQHVTVLCPGANLGYAGGINYSIRFAKNKIDWTGLWILNPDTEPNPEALAALVRKAGKNEYSVVGSRLLYKASGRIQSYGGKWRWITARGINLGRNNLAEHEPDIDKIEREIDYVSGASMFVTRSFVETVGLMDEKYFLYCEEVDWCFRRKNHKLGYAHDSIVVHEHGTTIGSSADRRNRSKLSVYLTERNKLVLTRKLFPARFPLVALGALVFTAAYLKDLAISNYWTALRGWVDGLAGRSGRPPIIERN